MLKFERVAGLWYGCFRLSPNRSLSGLMSVTRRLRTTPWNPSAEDTGMQKLDDTALSVHLSCHKTDGRDFGRLIRIVYGVLRA